MSASRRTTPEYRRLRKQMRRDCPVKNSRVIDVDNQERERKLWPSRVYPPYDLNEWQMVYRGNEIIM